MGTFIANLHLHGVARDDVVTALPRLGMDAAYVKDEGGWVSVFPRDADETGGGRLEDHAKALSAALKCPVIAFVVHDSDIFYYFLFENGRDLDRYDSAPGHFEGDERSPDGGNVKTLKRFCRTETTEADLARLLHLKRPAQPVAAVWPPVMSESMKQQMLERLRLAYPVLAEQQGARLPGLDVLVEQIQERLASAMPSVMPGGGNGTFTFAEDMVHELAWHLGLSSDLATASYRYIQNGETGSLEHVGGL